MEGLLEQFIRQVILYSLPVLVSLSTVSLIESKLCGKPSPHLFHAFRWGGAWLPCIAAILFSRGMIVALPQPLASGERAARSRALAHLVLCAIGFLLYSWSLNHRPPTGLPPLHHWWAKVLMFFNLCMLCMHLLPLPGQWLGELCRKILPASLATPLSRPVVLVTLYTLLAATPLLDITLGAFVVFPIYGALSAFA